MEELLKNDKEEIFIEKDKHKFIKIFIPLLLILGIIGGGGYYYYTNYWNNPNYIISTILKAEKKALNKDFENNSEKNKFKISGLTTINIDFDKTDNNLKAISDLINNLTIQSIGEFDTKLDIYNINLNTKYEDKEFINLNTYIEENNIYLKLNNLLDKYLKVDNDETKNVTKKNVKITDIKNIINAIIDSLDKTINKQNFNREKDKITIEKQEYDVYNNYLVLKDNEINIFIISILNDLKDNQEFLDSYKKTFGSDIKEEINNLINQLQQEKIIGTYKFSFYTTDSLLNSKLISIQIDENIENEKTSLIINMPKNDEINIEIVSFDSKASLKVKKNSSTVIFEMLIENNEGKIKLTSNFNFEEISSVSKPDLTNAINIQELKEQDAKEIEEKIANNEAYLSILKVIESLSKNENNI